MEQFPQADPTLDALEQLWRTFGESSIQVDPQRHEAPIESPPPRNLSLPPNIRDLLDQNLVNAGMPGSYTAKYRIKGHPDYMVRHNNGATREDLVLAYEDARGMGLPILPAEFIKHKGKAFAVTAMVDGINLEKALAYNPAPELLEAVQRTWGAIAEHLATARQNGAYRVMDVQDARQFMWGTIPGDTQKRLWMVDLPTNSYELDEPDVYGIELLHSISSMLHVEEAVGGQMTLARQQYGMAIAQCPDSRGYGDGFRNAATHCLATGQGVVDAGMDEYTFITPFRTR